MTDLTLHQQNGILIITVPDDVADRAGWTIGLRLNVTVETVSLTPASRLPRGRKTLANLLSGIDQSEISYLNEESHDGLKTHLRAKNQSEGLCSWQARCLAGRGLTLTLSAFSRTDVRHIAFIQPVTCADMKIWR